MNTSKVRVGITHGDLGGISYEIIIKALIDPRIFDMCTIVIYGSKTAANFHKNTIKELTEFNFNIITSADKANPKRANLIVCGEDTNLKVELGQPDPIAGRFAVSALDAAMTDIKSGLIDVLVTCPINKKTVTGDNFNFIGHTEYLSAQFENQKPLMFMVSDMLKVGLVTMHSPLREVADNLSVEQIVEHLQLINTSMLKDFTVRSPKIAVLGLNPHSGDEGLLGTEEQNTIIPAINKAKEQGILAFGPFAADGFFGSGTFQKFDAVLAMYHDQGLAPFKALTFSDGVNFTAGLPIVRTSPAHGVGYDIAGKDIADPAPLRAAIYAAADIFRNRKTHEKISANPLTQYNRNENNRGGRDRDANVDDMNLEHNY